MPRAQAHHAAQDALRQRADEAAARLRGDEQAFGARHLLRHARSACRRSPARSSCTSTSRATGSTAARPARSAGRCRRRSACAPPIPTRSIVALSGDYDFQFMIEELAVGAQLKLPYLHVVVNNSYLGLIRQAQRGFEMDFCVSARASTTSTRRRPAGLRRRPRRGGRGPGLQGDPRARAGGDRAGARSRRRSWMDEHQVPVVVEIILERVTNIAMGTEIDNVIEFEERCAIAQGRGCADGGRRCSTESDTWTPDRARRGTRCRSFAANLTMLFNEVDFLDRFAAAAQAGLRGRRVPVPLRLSEGGSSPSGSTKHGLDAGAAQPAGRRLGGGRARHRLPARPRRRVPGRRRHGDRLRDGARLPAGQLPGRHRAAGRRRRDGARDRSSRTCASPRGELGAGRHPAADRADQHARHSGLLPQPHRAGARRSSTTSARTTSSCSTTSITCRAWRAISRRTIEAHLGAHRAHPARRQSRAATSRAPARSTIRSCSAASTRSATTAGSAANTSRRPTPTPGSAGCAPYRRRARRPRHKRRRQHGNDRLHRPRHHGRAHGGHLHQGRATSSSCIRAASVPQELVDAGGDRLRQRRRRSRRSADIIIIMVPDTPRRRDGAVRRERRRRRALARARSSST